MVCGLELDERTDGQERESYRNRVKLLARINFLLIRLLKVIWLIKQGN